MSRFLFANGSDFGRVSVSTLRNDGYVVPTLSGTNLLRGHGRFGPKIARRLSQFFMLPRSIAAPLLFPELTAHEREVLHLIAQGHNNRNIARSLQITVKTVRNHVSNIFSKLQVADRAEAIIQARNAGFG